MSLSKVSLNLFRSRKFRPSARRLIGRVRVMSYLNAGHPVPRGVYSHRKMRRSVLFHGPENSSARLTKCSWEFNPDTSYCRKVRFIKPGELRQLRS